MDNPTDLDPIAEARRQWIDHGWKDAADGMEVVLSIINIQRLLLAAVDEVLEPLELNFSRFSVLTLLSFTRAGKLPLGVISSRLQVHPASVTNVVDRLEEQQLVKRVAHPTDRRATLAVLTPKGRRVIARALEQLNATVFGRLPLDEQDLPEITDALRVLRTAVRAAAAENALAG